MPGGHFCLTARSFHGWILSSMSAQVSSGYSYMHGVIRLINDFKLPIGVTVRV